MTRIRTLAAGLAMGLLAAASLLSGSSLAGGAEQTTIEIHHRLCPVDQTITDYFTDCHDHLLGQSFDFTITSDDGTQTVSTDADTSNAFATVTAGTVEISGGVPGEFAKTFVYCSQDGVGIDVDKTDIGVTFDAPAGDVVCDWYNTPEDLKGDDGDNAGGVTTLPNTGAGPVDSPASNLALGFAMSLGVVVSTAAAIRRRSA